MKPSTIYLVILAFLTLAPVNRSLATEPNRAAERSPLTPSQAKFLSSYESVRAALASDNLKAAKAAALELPPSAPAGLLAKADSLNLARMAFKKLSDEAQSLVRGRSGYYVAHCPMVDSDWVQTTKVISNPYLGMEMATCGHIRSP